MSATRQENPAAAKRLWSQQWQFTLKELRETLRDRRTIITLLAMPLLMYPLLGLGMRFLAVQQLAKKSPVFLIAVETVEEANWLKETLKSAQPLLDEDESGDAAKTESADTNPPKLDFLVPDHPESFNLRESVASADADIGVRIRTSDSSQSGSYPFTRIEVIQREGHLNGRNAADYIGERLRVLNAATVTQWGQARDPRFQIPLQERREIVESEGRPSAILGLLPLILLLMTVTGGVYPAIDLTAGERERDTLETLMALPVPKFRLLFAKYVAVVSVTLLTGLMNLLAMTVTVFSLQLESTLFGETGLTISLALRLCLVLSSFACFYSAVLLMLTSSARSFKEAQALLIPLLLLSLAPGLVIMLPGWHLTHGTAVVPVVNMLLMAREVLEGTATLLPSIAAVVSTILYGAAALGVAARVFGTDAASVGSRGRWNELLSRPEAMSASLSLTMAATGLAVLFPAYFVASGLFSRNTTSSMTSRLITSGVLTMVLFAGLPVALLLWRRISVRSALQIKWPSAAIWPGVALLGAAAWPWIFEMVVWMHSFGLNAIDESKLKQVESLLAGWRTVPLPLIVITLGVLPGVCEEIFFRGFLFGGLRSQMKGLPTVILTAVAFGLFHVILAGGAAPERVLPSTCMGLMLGWVRWRSDSLLPSMLLHVTHNSLLLTMAHYQEQLKGWNIGIVEQSHLPGSWLIVSAIAVIAGVALVWWSTRTRW